MSIQGNLKVEARTSLGSRASDKLRKKGLTPGNVYGHKEKPVSVTASSDELFQIVKSGHRVLEVEGAGEKSTVLLREVQWDFLGSEILHFDLQRVDPNEKLTLEVHIDLRGTAPGVIGGGVLDHSQRTLTIECPVIAIPDHIVVKIGNLEIGQAIHVREVELPPNTRCLNNPETIVVRVAKAVELQLTTPTAEGAAQPELIGKKPTEEGEEGDGKKADKK